MECAAILVLYNPNIDEIKRNIKFTLYQVDQLIIIDNSDKPLPTNLFEELPSNLSIKLTYISNNENLGIALAQNIGIKKATELNVEFILFLDQDSVITENMVNILINDLNTINQTYLNIIAIGPDAVNVQNNNSYYKELSSKKSAGSNYVIVEQLISSGMLMKIDSFKNVGPMDESLFIDGVDYEWCWRAKLKGYRCAVTRRANLLHMLGEGDKKIFGVNIAITSSFRVYYQFRNYFFLIKRNYVPVKWKIKNGIKYFFKFFYFSLFTKTKIKYLKNMIKGIMHGLQKQ